MNQISKLFRLRDQLAVVAGGAGIIGTSLCEALAEAEATVVMLDSNEELAERQAAKASDASKGRVIPMVVDITDENQVVRLGDELIKKFGQCDILINAAHYKQGAFFASLDKYSLDAWQKVLDVNLTGTFLMCREFGGRMFRGNGGTIVNVSSTYGVVSADPRIYGESGINSPVSYAATKSAILNFTRYIAIHWRPKVRANVLVPGGVEFGQDPAFIRNYEERTPLGRMAQPDDYKGAILFMCSEASAYMTGSMVTVDGGWTAW